MYTVLLFIHLFMAMIWLGGALAEAFYFIPQFKKVKNGLAEAYFIKVWSSSGPYYGPAVLLLLITGIILTLYGGWGFFESFWLGTKQGIMIVILIIGIIGAAPNMAKTQKMANEWIEKELPVDDTLRKQYNKTRIYFDIMHVGVFINVIFAIFRF